MTTITILYLATVYAHSIRYIGRESNHSISGPCRYAWDDRSLQVSGAITYAELEEIGSQSTSYAIIVDLIIPFFPKATSRAILANWCWTPIEEKRAILLCGNFSWYKSYPVLLVSQILAGTEPPMRFINCKTCVLMTPGSTLPNEIREQIRTMADCSHPFPAMFPPEWKTTQLEDLSRAVCNGVVSMTLPILLYPILITMWSLTSVLQDIALNLVIFLGDT